jgi:lantibiotic modifying enzyme
MFARAGIQRPTARAYDGVPIGAPASMMPMSKPATARIASVIIICGLLAAAAPSGSPAAGQESGARYLDAAQRAAAWVRSAAVTTATGRDWPPNPLEPSAMEPSFYAGTPGVVLFFLELARAAGDRSYLDDAARGAETVLASATAERGCGLWEGLAGSAFVLQETAKATGDRRFADGARRVTEMIVRRAKPAGAGVEWGDTTDIISGDAGTGLFLLYAAREFKQPALAELAARAGSRLIELARKEGTGLKWAMDPTFPRLMPNFSHGTAGIAYFLAALYGETHDRRFLDAALAGARYLQAIAKTEGEVCLVFHNEPDGKDLYYLGWCHGPVGTARLFFRLYQVTKDREWLTWVQKSAQAIRASGIPETRPPGFWNNVSQCCGSAGVADFFLALWRETGDRLDLDFARRMIDDMLARATPAAGGLKWVQAEHRSQPQLLIAQTGYMQGAAGIGSALVHFAAALDKRPVGIRFPNSPF